MTVIIFTPCDVCSRPLRTIEELGVGRHSLCARVAAECEKELDHAARIVKVIEGVLER